MGRRLRRTPSSNPDGLGRHALVVMAANTYFPEAGIEDLPMWAAIEVAHGLRGPLRERIATTQPEDPELTTLRDDLMVALGGRKVTKLATRHVDDWIAHPDQRSAIDARIVELTEKITDGQHLAPLEERAV